MKRKNKVTRNRTLESVRLADLRVDPNAQQQFRQYWADRLYADFDPDKMGTVEVSKRGSLYYVNDGQHRIQALIRWIGDGWEDQCIDVWVAHDMTVEEEAEAFLALNTRRKVPAFDFFRIAVVAGRKNAVAIQQIVESQGMAVSQSDQEGSVSCVSTLEKIYRRDGGPVLAMALRLAFDAFGQPGLDAKLLDGLGLMLTRYGKLVNDASTPQALASLSGGLGAIRHMAAQYRATIGKPVPDCIAAACVDAINKKRSRGHKLARYFAKEA